jgi:hypothetical protein
MREKSQNNNLFGGKRELVTTRPVKLFAVFCSFGSQKAIQHLGKANLLLTRYFTFGRKSLVFAPIPKRYSRKDGISEKTEFFSNSFFIF